MKSKYKKVLKPGEEVNSRAQGFPIIVDIVSDGNVLEFVAANGDVLTYKFTKSKTNLGKQVTFTKESMTQLLKNNETFKNGKRK